VNTFIFVPFMFFMDSLLTTMTYQIDHSSTHGIPEKIVFGCRVNATIQ